MQEVLFMSRWDMKKNIPHITNKYAVISVNDTEQELHEIKDLLSEACEVLSLVVKDDDEDFNDAHAEEIKKFVNANSEKSILVHCFAGISRSAAIARWAEYELFGELSPRMKNYSVYNKHVYDVLSK